MRRFCYLTFGLVLMLVGAPAWAQSLTPDGAVVIGTSQVDLSDTDSINAALSALDSRVATLEGDVATLQSQVTALQSDVAQLQTQIGDHESRLTALETGNVFVLRSTAAGNDLTSAFMGTQAECDAISPKDAGTFYACQ